MAGNSIDSAPLNCRLLSAVCTRCVGRLHSQTGMSVLLIHLATLGSVATPLESIAHRPNFTETPYGMHHVQGTFKQAVSMDHLVYGMEFDRQLSNLPAPWFLENMLLPLARKISPSLRVGTLDDPFFFSPMITASQVGTDWGWCDFDFTREGLVCQVSHRARFDAAS